MLAPKTPVPLYVEATRSHDKGNSVERVVDNRIDRLSIKLDRALWSAGTTHFAYNIQQQESSSGSARAPILSSRQDSQTLSLDTQLRFGMDRQYDLTNNITYSTQKYTLAEGNTPKLDDLRFLLNYRGIHSSQWQSFANYFFSDNRQDDRATQVNSAIVGATWSTSKNSGLSASLRAIDTQAPQFKTLTQGIDGSARYDQALPIGTGQMSYSFRYDQRTQTASGTKTAIVGERIVLNGTSPSALLQPRVTFGSVVVRNASRTQVFIEGIDYLLTVVGNATRIQSILSGILLDGETVLVDYSFDIGGTYANTELDQTLNLNWAVSRFMSIYARHADSAPRVTSGTPSSPLNVVKSTLYGTRADIPLGTSTELLAGGFLERENRRETIAPYLRTAGEVYLQGDLPGLERASFRAATRRTRVQAENVLQSVDLLGYDLMLGWHYGSGVRMTASGYYERDRGGFEPRERRAASLKALWRFRRLIMSIDVSRTRESQGAFTRDRTLGHLNFRRDL
jgi:hypothetical protein